jgi:hypothetical protein
MRSGAHEPKMNGTAVIVRGCRPTGGMPCRRPVTSLSPWQAKNRSSRRRQWRRGPGWRPPTRRIMALSFTMCGRKEGHASMLIAGAVTYQECPARIGPERDRWGKCLRLSQPDHPLIKQRGGKAAMRKKTSSRMGAGDRQPDSPTPLRSALRTPDGSMNVPWTCGNRDSTPRRPGVPGMPSPSSNGSVGLTIPMWPTSSIIWPAFAKTRATTPRQALRPLPARRTP